MGQKPLVIAFRLHLRPRRIPETDPDPAAWTGFNKDHRPFLPLRDCSECRNDEHLMGCGGEKTHRGSLA